MIILNQKTKHNDINNDIFNKLQKLAKNNFYEKKGSFFTTNHHLINTKNLKWFKSFVFKKPINLLFSLDQFLFEFSKKKPQKRRSSEFQQQLKEQKKITLFYGNLSKKELTKIIKKAEKNQGYFYRNFLCLLEKRLDVALYRSGFAKTIPLSRQLITHKTILVNNKIITIPGYILQPGDCISVHPKRVNFLTSFLLNSFKKSWKKRNAVSKLNHAHNAYSQKKNLRGKSGIIKKSYNTLNGLIYSILKKINSRTHFKITKNSILLLDPSRVRHFLYPTLSCSTPFTKNDECMLDIFSNTLSSKSNKKHKNHLTLIKYKPLISSHAKYLLFSLKQNGYLFSEKKPVFINSRNYFYLKSKQLQNSLTKQKSKKLNTTLYQSKSHVVHKTLMLKTFILMNSNKLFKHFLIPEFKNNFIKKLFSHRNVRLLKLGGLKSLHLEISYSLLKAIYLYSPQRLNFPFHLNIDLLSRAFK